MNLNRRKFVFFGISSLSLGLLSVSGIYFWKKNQFQNKDIEAFLYSYDNIISIDTELRLIKQVTTFEKEIISLLKKNGIDITIQIINKNIQNEYKLGKIKLINGWIITETELNILALKNKYV